MYRALSAHYDQLYQEHLEAFQRRLVTTFPESTKYTDFYPSIGVPAKKPVEFLFYGQAVGGWQPEHDYVTLLPDNRVGISREYSNKPYATDSPLNWVNVMWSKRAPDKWEGQRQAYSQAFGTYNPSRSLFWQVITYMIQRKCGIESSSWAWTEKLVWSNLYKIAPQVSNPDEADRILQRPECVGLVEQELVELEPKYCVVLTNDAWWSHFRRGLKTVPVSKPTDGIVESVERFGSTTIVVVKRPRMGSYKKTVELILPFLSDPVATV